MKPRRLPALVAALATAILAIPSGYAEGKLEPPDLSRYVRWGPLRVRPGLVVSNVGYDDNIFFNTENPVSDYTATLAPRLEGVVLFGRRAFLTFDERVEYTGYLHNTDQGFFNQKGSGRITLPLRRMGVYADLGLYRVEERPVDRQDLRPTRVENDLGLGLILQPGWRTELELGATHADFSYSDPDFLGASGESIGDLLDRSVEGLRLALDYRLRGRTRLLFDSRRDEIDFDRNDLQDARQWTVLSGVRLERGGAVEGTLRLGWSRIDVASPALANLSELVGDAELVLHPLSRTRVEIEAERVPGFALAQADPYFVDTSLSARVVRYFNRLFGVEAGAIGRRVTFPTSPIDRLDRVRQYDTGIRLRLSENALGRRVEYRLRVGRYRRESDLAFQNQSQTTVSANAVFGY